MIDAEKGLSILEKWAKMDSKNQVIILLTIIVGAMGYVIYKLYKNGGDTVPATTYELCTSNVALCQSRLDSLNMLRYQEKETLKDSFNREEIKRYKKQIEKNNELYNESIRVFKQNEILRNEMDN